MGEEPKPSFKTRLSSEYPGLNRRSQKPDRHTSQRDGTQGHDPELRRAWCQPLAESLEDKLLPRVKNWIHALSPNALGITPSVVLFRETQIFEILDAERREGQVGSQASLVQAFWAVRELSFVYPSVRVKVVSDQFPYTFSVEVWLGLTDDQKEAVLFFQAAPAFVTRVWLSLVWVSGKESGEKEHEMPVNLERRGEWEVTLDEVEPDKPLSVYIEAQYSGGTCFVFDWEP